jgi:large subunit ribosomal protein L18
MARQKRVKRIRKKISGTADRPRLRVFKSSKHIYAQIIDDMAGRTLASMSTLNKDFLSEKVKGKTEQAKQVGLMLAEQAKSKGIAAVVFDRGVYIYDGRV